MKPPVPNRIVFLFIIFFTCISVHAQNNIVITNVNVVDVKNGKILTNQAVQIVGERIHAIVPSRGASKMGSTLIDGHGFYLVPGLIDSHLHLHWWIQTASWKELHLLFKLMIANGITGFREASGGGFSKILVAIRDSIRRGQMIAPAMYVSGIASPQNMKRFNAGSFSALVDSFAKAGVDGIKIKFTTLNESREIIIAAKRNNLPVYGHTANVLRNETANILGDFTPEVIDAGIAGVMHSAGYAPYLRGKIPPGPEPRFTDTSSRWQAWWLYHDALWLYADQDKENALIQSMVKKNVWLEPTLSFESRTSTHNDILKNTALQYFMDKDSFMVDGIPLPTGSALDTARLVFQRKQQFVKKFHDSGGVLAAGTDGALFGADLRDELKFFVEAGLSPAAALKTATYNNAKILGWEKELGTIEQGKLANMVLLEANPLDDISNLQKIRAVLLSGQYYERSQLDSWLTDIRQLALQRKSAAK